MTIKKMHYKMQSRESFMAGNKMRKRIFSLAHQYGWTYYIPSKGRNVVNLDRLNGWMVDYSYLHKPLNYYTPEELVKLVSQWERVVMSYIDSQKIIKAK